MDNHRHINRSIALACIMAGLTACKIEIEVPRGGQVASESGSYACKVNSTCTIDVVDQYFDETFQARAHKGYSFYGWQRGHRALCGGSLEPCALSTEGFAGNKRLTRVLESNQVFNLTPIFIKDANIDEDSIRLEGGIEDTGDGLIVDGTLILTSLNDVEQVYRDAELELKFDEEGELLEMTGSAILPDAVTDHVGIVGRTRAELSLMKGHKINADPDIGIRLIDDRQYIVFYLGRELKLELGDRKGGSDVISISTPANRKLVMISDPFDKMFYFYGEVAGTARGFAESDQGLLPFVPAIDHPALEPFFANTYETGAIGVGIKAVDLIGLKGEYMIREPGFRDINLEEPFKSRVAYFAGFNGEADIAFSIFGFGLFNFDLAEASASFLFQPQEALARNSVGIYGRISPDVSWQPAWLPIIPQTEIQADFHFNAAGKIKAALRGEYLSTLPRATLSGDMIIDNESVTMSTYLSADGYKLPVSIRFKDQETHAIVGLNVSVSERIEREVEAAFARAEYEVANAQADLLAAIDDFEFELSLRGVRNGIPVFVDRAIPILSAVPSTAYDRTYTAVVEEINARRTCFGLLGCIPSNAKRDAEAESAAKRARSTAQGYVNTYIDVLVDLKSKAAQADDADIREGLRLALLKAYDHRRISKTVTVSGSISGYDYKESYSFSFDVISPADAERVLMAANNIHRIQETSDIVITKQDIVDRLPTEDVMNEVRAKVEAGASRHGSVREVGYSVIQGRYSAYAILSDGNRYEVRFNVLSPGEAAEALGQLILDTLFP